MRTFRHGFLPTLALWLAGAGALPAQPALVADINQIPTPAASSNPAWFTSLGPIVLFVANDGINGVFELWRTDGTPAGTSLVADIYPGPLSSNPQGLIAMRGVVYFSAQTPNQGLELWRSDGTTAGTTIVKDIRPGSASGLTLNTPGIFPVGNILMFTASDGTTGLELWRSDGTTAGTSLLKDIWPGPSSSGGTRYLITVGEGDQAVAYFSADDGTTGLELWRSDRTTAGTYRLTDINPGPAPSLTCCVGANLVHLKGAIYYPADDGATGFELWRTDTTTGATTQVLDIEPGPSGSMGEDIVATRDTIYFAASTTLYGQELWKSDGTAAGTVLVKDIAPGPATLRQLTVVGDRVFFTIDDGTHGEEVWVSDGTAAGTVLVRDLWPGFVSSKPAWLTTLGDHKLLFAASEPTFGNEVWITDGTLAGTKLLGDINTAGYSFPVNLYLWGARLLCSADDGTTGFEPWSLDVGAWVETLGTGCSAIGSRQPVLTSSDPVIGGTVQLLVTGASASRPGLLLFGLPGAGTPLFGCSLYVNLALPTVSLPFPVTDPTGQWSTSLGIPLVAAWVGAELGLQGIVLPPGDLELTNGIKWVLGF